MKKLSEHLLDQADTLANLGNAKPRQADLRRAVSSTYYALFHALIDSSCRQFVGSQPQMSSYRDVISRAFSHKAMKDACRSFGQGQFEKPLFMHLPNATVSSANNKVVYVVQNAAIIRIARLFKDMQEKRNHADYDLAKRFDRSLILGDIVETRDAIRSFDELPVSNDEKKFFLACLLTWKQFHQPD